jgi:hypothetical protein
MKSESFNAIASHSVGCNRIVKQLAYGWGFKIQLYKINFTIRQIDKLPFYYSTVSTLTRFVVPGMLMGTPAMMIILGGVYTIDKPTVPQNTQRLEIIFKQDKGFLAEVRNLKKELSE